VGLVVWIVLTILGWSPSSPSDGVSPAEPETNIVRRPTLDPEMALANQQARATLPRFFELAKSGVEGRYLLKMRIGGDDSGEHVWMEVSDYRDGVFYGNLANDPLTPGYHAGDEVTLRSEDVEDWMVNTGKVRYGGYTIRVLLQSMAPEEQTALRAQLRD
jgi:uncharacterized protein YegJ (DUF2314 family)